MMQADVSTLFGLNVYTEKGIYLGRVNDVVLEVTDKKVVSLAVTKLNPSVFDSSDKGVYVPYRWVIAIGDIVIIKHIKDQFKKSGTDEKDNDYNIDDDMRI